MTPWLAFVAGLLGTGHCLGMCGGIVSSCFLRLGASGHRFVTHVVYHMGRISVYVAIGAIAGGFGEVLTQSGHFGLVQGVLQIAVGVAVVIMGLDILGWLPGALNLGFVPARLPRWLFRKASSRSHAPEEEAPTRASITPVLLAGVANGLLPCSLTFSIAVQAIPAGGFVEGAGLMAAFGAGTLPSMLTSSLLFTRLSVAARSYLLKAAAVTVMIMGVLQIWQGIRFTLVMRKLVL